MVWELGIASCPICGNSIHVQRVVCKKCHQLTDGLRPGIYYEGLERRSDPIEGRLKITASQIARWKEEKELRVKRRELQRLARELKGSRRNIGEFLNTLEDALSEAYSHYFDAADAAETVQREINLVSEIIESDEDTTDSNSKPDWRALDRAQRRLQKELDYIFKSLSQVSAGLDKVAHLDKLVTD